VNRGTLGVNNLPRVVARIVPRSESNPRPLDHESSALTTTPPSASVKTGSVPCSEMARCGFIEEHALVPCEGSK